MIVERRAVDIDGSCSVGAADRDAGESIVQPTEFVIDKLECAASAAKPNRCGRGQRFDRQRAGSLHRCAGRQINRVGSQRDRSNAAHIADGCAAHFDTRTVRSRADQTNRRRTPSRSRRRDKCSTADLDSIVAAGGHGAGDADVAVDRTDSTTAAVDSHTIVTRRASAGSRNRNRRRARAGSRRRNA